MSDTTPPAVPAAKTGDAVPRDLGPLAWVMDELRGTLDEAVPVVRAFVDDNVTARATDLAEVDTTALRMLRQRVHQAAGALEMVNLGAAALTLRALEALLQRLVQRPATAEPAAAQQVEQGARALTDYLDRVMRERPLPGLALFPVYRIWQELAGAERVHPADLWLCEQDPLNARAVTPPPGKTYHPSPQVRAHLDKLVLLVVKQLNPAAAASLAQLSGGLSRGSEDESLRRFWLAAAAYFEAVAQGLLPDDVFVKRAASRILLQYASVAQGHAQGLQQLTEDLCFFAAQAQPDGDAAQAASPHLLTLREAYGWAHAMACDYHTPLLGLYDPQDLERLQAVVAAAQLAWSRWTEGDASAQAAAVMHLRELAAVLSALHAGAAALAGTWGAVAQRLEDTPAERPPGALALEVANSLLFLGAALDDFEPLDSTWPARFAALAQRLQHTLQGQAAPEPEPWMAEVYQRLSERQTLGHLVAQLQSERQALEAALDGFFRAPDAALLAGLPQRLEAMRGVARLLELPAAGQALQRVHDTVSAWSMQPVPPAAEEVAQAAQTLGPNLSALGWLLESFARQPALAREQFVFDAGAGLLQSLLAPVTGGAAEIPVVQSPPPEPDLAKPFEASDAGAVPVTAAAAADGDEDDEAELLSIFTDEAREVLQQMPQALAALRATPASLPDMTTVRRGFHTLKGSARMVGLADLGEAAWAMEQLLNVWLAEQRPATAEWLDWMQQVHAYLLQWVQGLVAGQSEAEAGASAPVRRCADALRLEGRLEPLSVPAAATSAEPQPAPVPEPVPEPVPVPDEPPLLDEAVKVIGPLRIDLELYNVYLNEADEWSRRLSNALSEWALLPPAPLPEEVAALAHSLAGASATVGYSGLSALARALEHALDRGLGREAVGQFIPASEAQRLVQAAEEARHLLHQFAAGFLKEPQPDTLDALAQVATAPVPVPAAVAEPAAVSAVAGHATLEAAPASPADVAAVIDQLDADLFSVFEDETQDLLPRLAAALRQWAARPGNSSARAEVLRNLHTFKGSARLAGALRLGDMAHQLESDVLALPEQPATQAVQPLLQALDALVARFDHLRAGFAASAEGQPLAVEGAQRQAPETARQPLAPAMGLQQPVRPPEPAAPAGPLPTVRVRAELLDQLMVQTGDVMLTRTRLAADMRVLRQSFQDMSGNIERLRSQLRDLELQTETQMQSRLAHSRETDAKFDPLEFDRYTRVQEITRLLAESVNDVATVQHNLKRAVEGAEGNLAAQARQTRDLQRDLLRTRLVAFDSLAERLHRVVRQTAQAQGKQARLDLLAADTEVDRGVLERLTPVLEHLLRNAVVHGIELPEQRLRAGKPAEGCVAILLQQSGNDLALTLTDDGAGLDTARLRERAVALGLHAPQAPFTPEDAARSMFNAGLSTANEVTELAGRGIGLDAVRNEVLGLGGHIGYFQPTTGGAGFKLVVPLSTAVTQVVMLRVGDFTFGVPAPWVETVHRAPAPELTAAYMSGQWQSASGTVPFFWAGALLALSTESTDPQAHEARNWPVLEFYTAGQRVAWHVDEVLGHQEVVIKPLGPQLARLPGLAGATVQASGAVALIYNPVALASLYGEAARAWGRAQRAQGVQGAAPALAGAPGNAQAPLVLVVDDSITVRRVTQRLLKREGYRVALASDGLQALERLREEAPVVVLCDIEMPHMDGFEFVQQLRASTRWADLPVVMITSRLADKHRDHAQSMGVDHYLGKPYSEEELLALVEGYARLAGAEQPVSIPT